MKLCQRFLRDSLITATIFSVLGFATALAVFWNAPQITEGSILAGLAAGIGGCLGWTGFCTGRPRLAWLHTVFAGIFAGIAVHPLYFLLESIARGQWLAPTDLLIGSMFSLLIAGVFTVPAGIIAASICRRVVARISRDDLPASK